MGLQKKRFFSLMLLLCIILTCEGGIPTDFYTCQPLDAQTKVFLEELNSNPLTLCLKETPLSVLRTPLPFTQNTIAGIDSIQMVTFAGSHGPVPVRLYTPKTNLTVLPVLLYFHGGGWALGSLNDYDSLCQSLAVKAECLVLSVDYHLAPEHPFPIPLQDCYDSAKWATQNIHKYKGDSSRLAVGGDSAGGNLAAAVTLMTRDRAEFRLIHQTLIYPALSCQFDTPSYELFKENFFLAREDMKFFWNCYVQKENPQHVYISPLRTTSMDHLPPTMLIVADYDVLRDEALAYGRRLQAAGVPLTLKTYGTIHGFIGMEGLDISKKALGELTTSLKKALHPDLN